MPIALVESGHVFDWINQLEPGVKENLLHMISDASRHYRGVTDEAVKDVATKFQISVSQANEAFQWAQELPSGFQTRFDDANAAIAANEVAPATTALADSWQWNSRTRCCSYIRKRSSSIWVDWCVYNWLQTWSFEELDRINLIWFPALSLNALARACATFCAFGAGTEASENLAI